MDLHKKKIVDYEVSLSNKFHEQFCQEYIRFDVEERINDKRKRRVKAYRSSFPETKKDKFVDVDRRALNLLRRKDISGRLKFLYDEQGASVESEYYWTKTKAEEVLVEIACGEGIKNSDKINAVKQLNQMRGIDAPKVDVEEDKESSISKFFKSVGGKVDK